jgi:phosphoribosylformimino-5-aminoimidazole carboxamide ribotide isomerase
MIILPAIDIRGGKCVRLLQGDYNKETIYAENPAEQAMKWEKGGAEIIHLVDLDGAKAGHVVNVTSIEDICKTVTIPCELGGGIRSLADAEKVLALGITRIILGTIACEKPELVKELLKEFGSDRIVLGIDAKNGKAAVKGWLETTSQDAFELAIKFAVMGVKRFIYTNIATDGMLTGPNFDGVALLCDKVPSCRIIASGGISSADDVKKLVKLNKANLEGTIVGKALYDGRTTINQLLKIK